LTRVYEGMFLLDNQVVREDWKAAKGLVATLLEKHGGRVHTSRRWDERKLAYPIRKRRRATFLLAYFDMELEGLPSLNRDLELSESVLRHLILQAESVPEQELELSKAEEAEGFSIPAPPPDDHEEEETSARGDADEDEGSERERRPRSRARAEDPEESADEGADNEAETAGATASGGE